MLLQYGTINTVLDLQEQSSSEKKIFAKNTESQNFNYYVSACFSYCSLRKQNNETFHYPLVAAEKILELH